jgi:hypothetical protein
VGSASQQGLVATENSYLQFTKDAEVGWRLPANTSGEVLCGQYPTTVVSNSLGIRHPPVDADAQILRIVVLGDSYTFGWGVPSDRAFPSILEQLLRGIAPHVPLEVVNAGIPGYAPTQQLKMLASVQAAFPFQIVIATYSLANDPVDELRLARYLPDRLHRFSYEVRDPESRASLLIRSSVLASLVDHRTHAIQYHLANVSPRALSRAQKSLADLASYCMKNDLALLLVIVPRASEIQPSGRIKVLFNLATVEKSRNVARDVARSFDVPLVDLKRPLLSAQKFEDVYLRGDAHWNNAGHRAVASAIAESIPQSWLQPPEPH